MGKGLQFGVRIAQVETYRGAVDWLNAERAAQGLEELTVQMDPMTYPTDTLTYPGPLAEYVWISISGDVPVDTPILHRAIMERALQLRHAEQGGFDRRWAGRIANLSDLSLD